MSVSTTSRPMTAVREEAFGNTKINENSKNGKNEDKIEYLKTSFIQILCIQYPITL